MVQNYFAIPIDQATARIIAALGIFEAIDKQIDADADRIQFIENYTHEKIGISIYVLDRNINESNKETKVASYSVDFHQKQGHKLVHYKEDNCIKLSSNEMQEVLMKAVREIHEILIRNIKAYKEEFKLPDVDIDEDDGSIFE